MDIELLIIALGLVFTGFELRQNRKSQYIQVFQENQRRYDDLSEDRKEFFHFYSEENFSLLRLKKENLEIYNKLIHWEARFFRLTFEQWLEGHIRKSVPPYLRRDWDYAIRASMRNPIHRQAWQEEIWKTDFLGYKEFNEFIDQAIRNQR